MSGPVSANQMTGPQCVSICARDLEFLRLQHETATHASEKENFLLIPIQKRLRGRLKELQL